MNEFWRTFWMVMPFLSGALQLTATPAMARTAAPADLRAGTALPARRGRR